MDRSWSRVSVVWIDPCTVRIDHGSIPVERDRSWSRASVVWIGPRTVRIDHESIPVESLGRADRSWIDRGRGPRSCGSVHAPCGSIMDRSWSRVSVVWIGPRTVRIDHESIPVESLGRADRSCIDPGREPRPCGSIMDRSWSRVSVVWIDPCIDPCTVRVDQGSIPVERDRSWPTASAVWIDPIGAWIDHGSVLVERDRSLHHAGRSWIDRRSTGIDRVRPTMVRLQLHRSFLVRLNPFFFLNFFCVIKEPPQWFFHVPNIFS
ncbi:hypothetical protein ACJRO7_010553 [Eucalyptus globulus]|uniref:Uncharacterized protein n=1 Tax=Eucalyptus globulus TaxID=34317 RepID=A0ABD3LCD0_EUCGL